MLDGSLRATLAFQDAAIAKRRSLPRIGANFLWTLRRAADRAVDMFESWRASRDGHEVHSIPGKLVHRATPVIGRALTGPALQYLSQRCKQIHHIFGYRAGAGTPVLILHKIEPPRLRGREHDEIVQSPG